MIFQPETLIGWQRSGFRVFWRWKSRRRLGRPGKDAELIQLIRRMWALNPTWGSPLIRDELAKLGLKASTATIRKDRPKSRGKPSQSWRTFLQNHTSGMAAMDFFMVPTVTFRLRYVLVVITHGRAKVVHFHITEAATREWTVPQVVNAFPYDTAPKYLLRDRDCIYDSAFVQWVKGMGIKQKRIFPRSPWQSPYVEWLVGSIRRECPDQVIVFNPRQLRQLLQRYLDYYHHFHRIDPLTAIVPCHGRSNHPTAPKSSSCLWSVAPSSLPASGCLRGTRAATPAGAGPNVPVGSWLF